MSASLPGNSPLPPLAPRQKPRSTSHTTYVSKPKPERKPVPPHCFYSACDEPPVRIAVQQPLSSWPADRAPEPRYFDVCAKCAARIEADASWSRTRLEPESDAPYWSAEQDGPHPVIWHLVGDSFGLGEIKVEAPCERRFVQRGHTRFPADKARCAGCLRVASEQYAVMGVQL